MLFNQGHEVTLSLGVQGIDVTRGVAPARLSSVSKMHCHNYTLVRPMLRIDTISDSVYIILYLSDHRAGCRNTRTGTIMTIRSYNYTSTTRPLQFAIGPAIIISHGLLSVGLATATLLCMLYSRNALPLVLAIGGNAQSNASHLTKVVPVIRI